MDINELKSNTKLLISKSNRDDVISKFIPNDSIPNTPNTIYLFGFCGSGKSHLLESLMLEQYIHLVVELKL